MWLWTIKGQYDTWSNNISCLGQKNQVKIERPGWLGPDYSDKTLSNDKITRNCKQNREDLLYTILGLGEGTYWKRISIKTTTEMTEKDAHMTSSNEMQWTVNLTLEGLIFPLKIATSNDVNILPMSH